MESEANQTQVEASIVAQCTSSRSTGSRPSRESRHVNNSQEVQLYSDHLWQSKQRSSPSLLFYRKLSCDSGEGNILNEEYDCFDSNSKVLSTDEKLYSQLSIGKGIDARANTVTLISGKGSGGSRCQLDSSGEGGDAGRNQTGSTPCSCTMSSLYMSPDMDSYHSSTSSQSPSPSLSPIHSPRFDYSLSRPSQRHNRRSSLPATMLTFHKVIKHMLVANSIHVLCVLCSLKGHNAKTW